MTEEELGANCHKRRKIDDCRDFSIKEEEKQESLKAH